jgi:hypothetical protein
VKDYNILIILKNADLTDVRVIELIITILPKVFKAALDFITPVKIPIEQKIPVYEPLPAGRGLQYTSRKTSGKESTSTALRT